MYYYLLITHSWFRWLVLFSLLLALYRAYRGWLQKKPFTKFDNSVRLGAVIIAHIQLVLGLWLYAISPIVDYFLHHFKEAVHQRQARFFGMEHITTMALAVVVLTIGSVITKSKPTDTLKFRTMAIWFTIALLLILSSIPWSFSPIDSRPLFR